MKEGYNMWEMKCIFFFIICCFLGLVQSDDGYSGEVKELFQDLKDYKSNVQTAEQKMLQFSDETMDRKYAIGLVNLYTQQSSFYSTLNKEMRKNYPTETDIWRRSGDLINRGIDILGPTEHKLVFRGCRALDDRPEKGRDFKFNQITSTTLRRDLAKKFGDAGCQKGILFEISNVYGLLVEKYSAFKTEKEVLIKSYYVFKVKEDPQKIEKLTIYKLDGQSESINSSNRAYAEILMQCSLVTVLILTFGL
ncbi:uncharacterized protein LOC132718234 [Ruditapes philippinarum]|uniref:uncharacterized protein LOC132718234 n=1 Tax=Ruditapes philippinarum TaxID=129788 RepID=UPI00295BD83F|nr:uncharacterized protein LOC132718234 [Ruditapes philippinarum]